LYNKLPGLAIFSRHAEEKTGKIYPERAWENLTESNAIDTAATLNSKANSFVI
jgi:hypothetical protein